MGKKKNEKKKEKTRQYGRYLVWSTIHSWIGALAGQLLVSSSKDTLEMLRSLLAKLVKWL